MAQDNIPYELKRLVYEYVDLATIKALRQVSKAWATVGLELLLLPSFFVKSRSVDIQRLLAISSSPSVSGQLAKIRKLVFQNTAWDPVYFRRIVCSRHEHVPEFLEKDFVPTSAEAAALEELEEIGQQMSEDKGGDNDLATAFQALNGSIYSIEIETRNPFRHTILRKVWEEYAMESYRRVQWEQDLFSLVLSATQKAGMTVRHVSHDQLLFSYFEANFSPSTNRPRTNLFTRFHQSLSSLKLTISDYDGFFSSNEEHSIALLLHFFESFPALENLSLTIDILGPLRMNFLPTPSTGTLRSLALSSITIHPATFISVLRCHIPTLKRLFLRYVDILSGDGTWQALLGDIRNILGDKLEHFQLSGYVRSEDGEHESWLLHSYYDEKWRALNGEQAPKTTRAKELEDFVIRGGPWPMVESDNFVPGR